MIQVLPIIEVILLALILISLWAVLYQLVKQQGRLMLRQDEVEHRLMHAGLLPNGGVQPNELAVGTQVPSFRLPDLTGETRALEDFRGKQVLLVNWSPHCGYCDLIAPDLAQLQSDFEKRHIQLLFLSRGDADSNRKLVDEHGLKCPILLQNEEAQAQDIFPGVGTPAAYLLDKQGRVARSLVIGAEQVPALASEIADAQPKEKAPVRIRKKEDLSQSHIERNGLPPGTPAPAFTLPDVHGNTVSLDTYRGRRVLLVFTDPHCGPCDQIAPELAHLHHFYRDNGLALVMIGRGDVAENRQKAERFAFEFPVALQKRWEISRKQAQIRC